MTGTPDRQAERLSNLARVKHAGIGISIIAFPIMLFLGFVAHPNILSFDMVAGLDPWVAEWRGNNLFHFGHLLVMFAVPLIIFATFRFMSILNGSGAWYGLIGGVLSVFGAFMLAVDKGALTLTLTALQTIPDPEFAGIRPALQAFQDRAGLLWITWSYALLPVGTIVQTIGLAREKIVTKWQASLIIAGLALLLNPDIEIISSTGALLMCFGFWPLGLQELKGQLGSSS
ncbi:MAG: hypothetical protein WCC66_02650 [Rhizobiaceae bacterium]